MKIGRVQETEFDEDRGGVQETGFGEDRGEYRRLSLVKIGRVQET